MTVLVPYDGSEQAQFALDAAADKFPDRTLVLLHVLEPYADHTEAGGHGSEQTDRARDDAQELLDEAVDAVEGTAETAIRYGRPVHEIIRYIEENPVDRVVIGSHGREGAERLLLGSVAETVVRRSSVPVTVVRQQLIDAGSPDDVVVPFDGSQESRRALSHAIEEFPDSELTALYVTYPTTEGSIPGPLSSGDDAEPSDDESGDVLDIAEQTAAETGREIQTDTISGDPARAIVSYAETELVDHIVMGSHGRDGLTRLLLGSVAETVVRRAPTSVTVVR